MKKKLTKLNQKLIMALILAQPFIIMFQAMIIRDVQVFGLSVFESFNIILSVACMLMTMYLYPKKQDFIKFIPYIILLAIYLVIHIYNTYQFNNSIYPAQNPSFLVETYYIGRTFMVPLFLLFSIYYSGIEKERMIKILEILLFIIVLVMVGTNVFGIALQNYADGSVMASYRIFDWFSFDNPSKYSYYKLTTKGWFLSGNQMSAVLFMTFLITIYRTYKIRDKFHYLLLILQMLAMCMLGTKVANAGCILLLAGFLILWAIFALLKHKKRGIISLILILVVFVTFVPFTPVGYMYRYRIANNKSSTSNEGMLLEQAISVDISEEDKLDETKNEYHYNLIKDSKLLYNLKYELLSEKEKVFVNEYMNKYYEYYGISPYILENYDDLTHSEFWLRYLQETPNNDYRVLKTMILEDIYNNNNNPLDKFFGMGYTLNYIYTESDYSYQVYLYGIIGLMLFVGPYFIMLLYVVLKGLQNFKMLFTLNCAVYFFAPLAGLCVAKLSGHVLERGFPLMIVAITIGIILLHVKETLCIKKEICYDEQ